MGILQDPTTQKNATAAMYLVTKFKPAGSQDYIMPSRSLTRSGRENNMVKYISQILALRKVILISKKASSTQKYG